MTEEAQHRHHAVDGIEKRLRRRDVARREGLTQRQEFEQDFDDRAGIAAGMAAIGKNLPLDFAGSAARSSDLIWRAWPAMQSAA